MTNTIIRRFSILLVLGLFLSIGMVTPVAALDHNESKNSSDNMTSGKGSQVICGGPERVQKVFRTIVTIFMLFGFIFGMVFWAAEYFEKSVVSASNFQILGGLNGEGKDALKSGVLLPVVIYFIDFIDVLLFGVEIHCVVPRL